MNINYMRYKASKLSNLLVIVIGSLKIHEASTKQLELDLDYVPNEIHVGFISKKFIRERGSNGQNLKKIFRTLRGSISKS